MSTSFNAPANRTIVPSKCPPQECGAPSWLGLLTSTTLGSNSAFVRVDVQSSFLPLLAAPGDPLRLVIQVFVKSALRNGQLLPWARPSASAQRAVSAEALRVGVSVLLAGFERQQIGPIDHLVVAWVELGVADLDLDGAVARPSWDSCSRVVRLSPEGSRISLRLQPSLCRSLSARSATA